MAAGKYNFTIEIGSTFHRTLTWKDSVGNPINLTGYTADMQVRDKPGGTLFLELSSTNGRISLNALQGQVVLNISATDTALLSSRATIKATYELRLTDSSGVATRLLQGKVSFSESVIS